MRSLLSGIVNSGEGTGTPYKSDEVEIIGKTGTGQIAVKGGYSADFHTHLFAAWHHMMIQESKLLSGGKMMQVVQMKLVKLSKI